VDKAFRAVDRQAWRRDCVSGGSRNIAEETALALTYNGGTYAVMMGTPVDLEDFAVGFSLNTGIIQSVDNIDSLDIVPLEDGIDLRIWLPPAQAERLGQRRRSIAGPTGCGLCGIESIAEAVVAPATVACGRSFSPDQILAAMHSIQALQTINAETRAVHAAAFWTPERGIVALREDVGRHNALDKLTGALVRGHVPAIHGMVLLTSRVSIEMVQKVASLGAAVMVAISAPTTLAVRTAEAAGITLAAIARDDGFEVFTHPHRIAADAAHDPGQARAPDGAGSRRRVSTREL
jgi:FdhD protein